MSEYLRSQYQPIADALLAKHGLSVDDQTREALAKRIMRERTPPSKGKPHGRTPVHALRVALTHNKALLRYADMPPTRSTSFAIRSKKLAAALRKNELVGWELVLAKPSFDATSLLVSLDKGTAKRATLRKLLTTLESIDPENMKWATGRPWGAFTVIVRAGCITWQRAGRSVLSKWNVDDEKLSGAFPDFLRDLIACCNGTHNTVSQLERLLHPEPPKNYPSKNCPFHWPEAQGDGLSVNDMALRDAIRAYRKWCKDKKQNFEPFSLE